MCALSVPFQYDRSFVPFIYRRQQWSSLLGICLSTMDWILWSGLSTPPPKTFWFQRQNNSNHFSGREPPLMPSSVILWLTIVSLPYCYPAVDHVIDFGTIVQLTFGDFFHNDRRSRRGGYYLPVASLLPPLFLWYYNFFDTLHVACILTIIKLFKLFVLMMLIIDHMLHAISSFACFTGETLFI